MGKKKQEDAVKFPLMCDTGKYRAALTKEKGDLLDLSREEYDAIVDDSTDTENFLEVLSNDLVTGGETEEAEDLLAKGDYAGAAKVIEEAWGDESGGLLYSLIEAWEMARNQAFISISGRIHQAKQQAAKGTVSKKA